MKPRAKTKKSGGVATIGVFRDLALFGFLALLAVAHAWVRVEGTRAGYKLSSLHREQQELIREGQSLRLELATRRAASRIDADARTRLGMVEPSPDRIFLISKAEEQRGGGR